MTDATGYMTMKRSTPIFCTTCRAALHIATVTITWDDTYCHLWSIVAVGKTWRAFLSFLIYSSNPSRYSPWYRPLSTSYRERGTPSVLIRLNIFRFCSSVPLHTMMFNSALLTFSCKSVSEYAFQVLSLYLSSLILNFRMASMRCLPSRTSKIPSSFFQR